MTFSKHKKNAVILAPPNCANLTFCTIRNR
nr:MAG TPA: hypothetical protein [Bacteriophage sp.]